MILKPEDIDLIVLHCSALPYGDARLIDIDHRKKGWRKIGYHYVIHNCYPDRTHFQHKTPLIVMDGFVEVGRSLDEAGAHAKGFNWRAIGICLIGNRYFTSAQFKSLQDVISKLHHHRINGDLVGHYELDSKKTCPNIDMRDLRMQLGIINSHWR